MLKEKSLAKNQLLKWLKKQENLNTGQIQTSGKIILQI